MHGLVRHEIDINGLRKKNNSFPDEELIKKELF